MTERLKKIAEMEQILNEMNDLSEKVASVLEEWNESQEKYNRLSDYYQSQQWFDDNQAFCEGKIDIPCGVLSEDAVFDLFTLQRGLALETIKTGVSILENN